MSTLAASTCAMARSPAARRRNAVRRGRIGLDDRPVARGAGPQRHPVPDPGKVPGPAGLVPEATGRLRERLPVVGAHAEEPGEAGHHAARDEALGGERGEGRGELVVPAELTEARRLQARQPRRLRKSPMKSARAATDSGGHAL